MDVDEADVATGAPTGFGSTQLREESQEGAQTNGAQLAGSTATTTAAAATTLDDNGVGMPGAEDDAAAGQETGDGQDDAAAGAGTPLSKNQQKKLKRQQKWEDMRDDRKRRRKEKRTTKQAEKRAEKAKAGPDAAAGLAAAQPPKEHTLVPVSLIFDCDFETYMRETELISLSSQITRSYSANRTAARATRIFVSSWGGKLRTRYETLLSNQHKRWANVHFLEGDFVEAARQADAAMRGADGGVVVDVLQDAAGGESKDKVEDKSDVEGVADGPGGENTAPSVVYLTSDSPHTLTRLEPYTSYVIGGIVDKNREKGLCYGRAQARGIRTAKLPIGDYMVMASRQVLTTNHVVEIMLSWLETGDWATAFTNVIPKRKGGHLREGETEADEQPAANAGPEPAQDDSGAHAASETTVESAA